MLFYACFIPVMWWFSGISRSGPCTPGTDVLSELLLFLVSVVLCIVNSCTTLFGKKKNGVPAIIHLLVAIGSFALFF